MSTGPVIPDQPISASFAFRCNNKHTKLVLLANRDSVPPEQFCDECGLRMSQVYDDVQSSPVTRRQTF